MDAFECRRWGVKTRLAAHVKVSSSITCGVISILGVIRCVHRATLLRWVVVREEGAATSDPVDFELFLPSRDNDESGHRDGAASVARRPEVGNGVEVVTLFDGRVTAS